MTNNLESAAADATTYLSLRMLGEHILSAARYAATGRIGLSVVEGGIALPPYGPSNQQVAVMNGVLVITDDGGRREAPVTTLAAAGQFVGVNPGAPTSVYTPTTECDVDAALLIDHAAFVRITDWYSRVDAALRAFTADADITLWPEHFDIATRVEDVNYGGLYGDDGIASPYAYVGPDVSRLPPPGASDFWNAGFGAVITIDAAPSAANITTFFRRGREEADALSATSPTAAS